MPTEKDALDEHGRKPRVATERTSGVWTTCDDCGEDWWCVGVDRDYLDEPTRYVCSVSCEEGWEPADLLNDDLEDL